MTPAATPEALEQALTQTLWQQNCAFLQEATWEEALQKAEAIPDGLAADAIRTIRSKAQEIIAGPLGPLLAALATATAEAASLRAEVAAKDRALKIADEALAPFSRCAEVGLPYSFTGADFVAAHEARTALARAATAGEGRSDG